MKWGPWIQPWFPLSSYVERAGSLLCLQCLVSQLLIRMFSEYILSANQCSGHLICLRSEELNRKFNWRINFHLDVWMWEYANCRSHSDSVAVPLIMPANPTFTRTALTHQNPPHSSRGHVTENSQEPSKLCRSAALFHPPLNILLFKLFVDFVYCVSSHNQRVSRKQVCLVLCCVSSS